MEENLEQVRKLIESFKPIKAVETLDQQFGFPQTFLITLKNTDRLKVLEILEEYYDRNNNSI